MSQTLLTETKLKSLKPKEKVYKIADRNGLYIVVNPGGKMQWRLRYYENGKDRCVSIGTYPATSLATAREKCLELQGNREKGVSPTVAVNRSKGLPTFREVADMWLNKMRPTWSERTERMCVQRLEANIFPRLGGITVDQIRTGDFLAILQVIEAQGKHAIAHRIAGYCVNIMDYAVGMDVVEYNVAARLPKLLVPAPKDSHFATITDPSEIGRLLNAIDTYRGQYYVKMAAKIAPYVFVRSFELRGVVWDEIDLETATWTIPAERMKMKRPHIVPLSRQVVAMFSELKTHSNTELCFPSAQSKTRCISDVGLLNVIRRLGYSKDEMTIHGFRSMASTILNEHGFRSDAIERQLAHVEKNAVRAAYNYAQYLDERREMMQWWGDWLDGLKTNGVA